MTETSPTPAPAEQPAVTADTLTPETVPLGETTKVPVGWLTLDHANPRLVDGDQKVSDESIIAQLFRKEELGELLQSIASNGYLDIEPLVVMLDPAKRLTILEGNRRFAAIRLFREPCPPNGTRMRRRALRRIGTVPAMFHLPRYPKKSATSTTPSNAW